MDAFGVTRDCMSVGTVLRRMNFERMRCAPALAACVCELSFIIMEKQSGGVFTHTSTRALLTTRTSDYFR